jgi:NADPH2:quinone reductase
MRVREARQRVRRNARRTLTASPAQGSYAKHLLPALPFTPGSDGAGVVEAVGAGVAGVAAGARVWLSGSVSGTYAEFALAKEGDVHPLPDAVSFRAGAGIGTAYRTAYRALFTRAHVRAGQTVLVHGASGGVGLAAVQLARAAGCRVLGTAGSAEGLALVQAQGGEAVSHKGEGYMEEIRRLSPEGKGVDVILEMAAHENLNADMGLLARGGTIVIVGNRGDVNINPRLLMLCEGSVVGVLGPGAPDEARQVLAGIRGGLVSGALRPVVGPAFALEDAPASHVEVIEHKMGTKGKIVLDIAPEAKQEL